MAYKEILCTREGPVCFLTLNNPAKINALSKQMVGEITGALTDVSTDESVKVVVIKAAGKHFCSGHDLKEMTGSGAKENKAIFDNCTRMMRLMHEIPQPVITQVQGIATKALVDTGAALSLISSRLVLKIRARNSDEAWETMKVEKEATKDEYVNAAAIATLNAIFDAGGVVCID